MLSEVYRLYRAKRSGREQFLVAVLGLMEETSGGEASGSGDSLQKYLGDLLAFLPFETVGEPLAVVHAVDRIIALRTGAALKAFKRSLKEDTGINASIQQQCRHATLSIILIKLKAFLKWGYSLSTA